MTFSLTSCSPLIQTFRSLTLRQTVCASLPFPLLLSLFFTPTHTHIHTNTNATHTPQHSHTQTLLHTLPHTHTLRAGHSTAEDLHCFTHTISFVSFLETIHTANICD